VLDAIIPIKEMFERVNELGQKAVAITDHGNMASMHEAYGLYKQYKKDGSSFKFIPGNEIYFVEDLEDKKAKRRHLVLLAANEEGYKNLLSITAEGYLNAVTVMNRQFPRVTADILKKYNRGLFATSACGGSLIAAAIWEGDRQKALDAATVFKNIFGNRFFIELQPHDLHRGDFNQGALNDQIKTVAEELDIQMIATCDSHYLTPKHERYHDMVLAISSKKALDDPKRHRYASVEPCIVCAGTKVFPLDSDTACDRCMGTGLGKIKQCAEFYLKTEQEMYGYFAKRYNSGFAKQLINNTSIISDACDPPDYMEPGEYRLPIFPWQDEGDASEFRSWRENKETLEGLADDAAYLRFKSWKAMKVYCRGFDKDKIMVYWQRLNKELEILEARSFSSYILIVADFVNWAKNNGVRVGPGRGSGAGSLVGYFMGIHDVDSIKYKLLFERFQSRLRPDPPDYDIDFAPSGRDRVIDYCRSKYGRMHVAQISNVLRLTPKLVIKDVSRSLQLGGDKSSAFKIANEVTSTVKDEIVKGNKKIKVDDMSTALDSSRRLREFVIEYPEVLDYSKNIVGLPKTFATHAGGLVISDIPLNEYIPLRCDKAGSLITQYDKDACEDVKLVKMDFLATEVLDVISETIELASGIGIGVADTKNMPLDDSNTYRLIATGYLAGVFQLAGSLTSLCKAIKPRNIYDIALINALGRPNCSPKERADFIARRFGKQKTTYTHPALEPVLKETLGIPIFDEDLLRIANHVAGWDLSKADGLRKLTKLKSKGEALADKLEKDFISDTVSVSKISKDDATTMWNDVVVPFTKYGFNLSHAIAYSMISYYTAYYKVHATAPFLCAALNKETRGNKQNRSEQIDILKRDCKRFKISIRTCDINKSKQYYTVQDKSTIITGLGAIKGIGDKALDAIISHQPYASFADFLHRTPSRTVSKSVVIALAQAGAFDSFGISRKYAATQYDKVRKIIIKDLKALTKKFESEIMVASVGDGYGPDESLYALEKDYLVNFVYSLTGEHKEEWSLQERLSGEKTVLGEYLSGSAEDIFPGFFKGGIYGQSFVRIAKSPDGVNFNMEGLIVSIREIAIKKPGRNLGKLMAKLNVENLRGETVDVTLWPQDYSKFKRFLGVGIPIRGLFKVNEYNGSKSLVMLNLEAIYRES